MATAVFLWPHYHGNPLPWQPITMATSKTQTAEIGKNIIRVYPASQSLLESALLHWHPETSEASQCAL